MELLDAILASQKAGNANYQNPLDSYESGVQAATNETQQRQANQALNSRNTSNQLIANGDLIGALRNSQAAGDLQYTKNLEDHIQHNREQLGAIAQSLTSLPQEHRAAALAAANNGLEGMDVDTNSLSNMNDDQLRALANSTIGTGQQIKNNQVNRSQDIDQQNANTSGYNAQTSRINSGIEQQNANTARDRLGLSQQELNANIAHMQNNDNAEAFKNSRATFTDEDGNTYAYHDSSAPQVIAIPNAQGTTLADRNNNPGNLVFAGQPGATKSASGYASFADPQDGVNANLHQIDRDINVHGYNTIDSLVDHWASTSKPEERAAYKVALSRSLGKQPDAKLTSADVPNLLPIMAKQEGYSGSINSGTSTDGKPSQTRMVTLPNGDVVPAMLIKASKMGQQTNRQAQAGINYDMAKSADATLTQAEMNGDIPSKHPILDMLPNWYASLPLPGATEKGKLLVTDNAAKHFSQEANTLYHPQGGSQFTQEEQDHLVVPGRFDTNDLTSSKAAYRRNVMNDLQVRSKPAGVVTEQTLAPGYVNPTTYDARNGTDTKTIRDDAGPSASAPPTRDDVISIRRAASNKDASALKSFTQKYGKDRVLSILSN